MPLQGAQSMLALAEEAGGRQERAAAVAVLLRTALQHRAGQLLPETQRSGQHGAVWGRGAGGQQCRTARRLGSDVVGEPP